MCNSYPGTSNLFINKQTIFSLEGTPPSLEPLAMSMYGMTIICLIDFFDDCLLVQMWYADDGNAVGSLDNLKELFDSLKNCGPAFGYHLIKRHIITKEHFFERAQQIFDHDEVKLVGGCGVLDSVIGSD